ncbi:baseplate complex protein [Vibrio algicola]|uniref:DNA-binding protein n=1 Tax=Vibrio algicola TaxID=2662262 RepID=A0A5Q0TD96_9VIBR|nr:DNA-binding protein [Vibrio algicola]
MFNVPDFDININDYVDIPNSTGNRTLDLFLGLAPSRLNNPILSIDGEMLPLKSCKIDPSFDIKEADVSGQTSSTSKAKQGNKGCMLNVNGLIPFSDPTTMTKIFNLARAVDEKGNSKVYVIGCDTAQTLKIRQVSFTGKVAASQASGLRAWNVAFTLREHISANELIEKQQIAAESNPLLDILSIPKGLVESVDDVQGNIDTLMDDIQKQIQDQFK